MFSFFANPLASLFPSVISMLPAVAVVGSAILWDMRGWLQQPSHHYPVVKNWVFVTGTVALLVINTFMLGNMLGSQLRQEAQQVMGVVDGGGGSNGIDVHPPLDSWEVMVKASTCVLTALEDAIYCLLEVRLYIACFVFGVIMHSS